MELSPTDVLKEKWTQSEQYKYRFGCLQRDDVSRNVRISTILFVFVSPHRTRALATSNLLSVAGLVRAGVLKQSATQSDQMATLEVGFPVAARPGTRRRGAQI